MRLITLFLVVLLTGGCNSAKKDKYPEKNFAQYNYRYEKLKYLLVPKSFFSHFPEKFHTPFFSQIILDEMAYYYSYVFATYNCDIEELKQLKKDLIKSNYKSYLTTDSTLLVVNNQDFALVKDRLKKGDVLVPYFNETLLSTKGDIDISDFYSSNTPTGLSSNFEIIIIENKSIYNSTESEKKILFRQMPAPKKYAFSRSICINLKSRYVIYWTIFL